MSQAAESATAGCRMILQALRQGAFTRTPGPHSFGRVPSASRTS
jgi:hypothetical protein